LVLIAALSTLRSSQPCAHEAGPQYDSSGQLKLPLGFANWIFVGSNLGLGYASHFEANTPLEMQRPSSQTFHNIYIDPDAYAAFIKTGIFPNGTVLIMAVYAAADKEPRGIVDKGYFNGAALEIEAAVKNAKRPDGKSTDWAYYAFPNLPTPADPQPVASAFDDAQCYACHRLHASTDNVWVQFYPILRDRQPLSPGAQTEGNRP
jgi:hypothetical protein